MTSCDYDIKPPYTSSTWISDIGTMGATAKSRIIWDGGSVIKECGFCWNTSGYPTKDDFYIEANEVSERISAKLKDLTDGTKYYVRSYAINKAGVFYGEVKNFTTIAFKLPSVSTPYVSGVTHNTASFTGGGISSDNSYNIISKGICWSTSKNPTLNDQTVDLGSGFGGLGCTIEGLTPGTVYYIRAYATNVVGTTYGGNQVIRTYDGSVTDYDGHIYSTVSLGNQEWMTRNLKTKHFSNGDPIETTYPVTLNTEQQDKPIYQWVVSGQEDLGYYERLYTWYTATDSRKLCPAGWHLPSINEWNELLVHLGGDKLTSRDFRWSFNYYWDSFLNAGATEGSFGAELVGYRTASGQIQYSRYGTYWWSGTEASSANVYVIYCGQADFEKVIQIEKEKKNGFSVRCVKD